MKKKPIEVIRSYAQQESQFFTERNIWREVYAYTVPQKSKYYNNYNNTENKIAETYDRLSYLYDSVGVNETIKTASSFSSYIVNPHSEWFKLEPSDPEQSNDTAFRAALQRITDQAHKELRNTNFHQNIQENFIDLTAIGNSAYIIESGDSTGNYDLITFLPVDMINFYWEEDGYGRPALFWRCVWMNAFQIVSRYLGSEEITETSLERRFGRAVKDAYFNQSFQQTFKVIHHAYPIDPNQLKTKPPMGIRYYSQHVLSSNSDEFLSDKVVSRCPYGTFRGLKIADSPYGIGQGLMALPNLKTQQKLGRSALISSQKVVEPPFMVPANPNYVKSYATYPNAKNIVDMSKGEKVEVLSDFRLRELFDFFLNHREIIKEMFHAPQLDITKGQYETARATAVNAETSLKVLTPIVARLERETFAPIISRVIDEMRMKSRAFNLDAEFELLKESNYRIRFSSDLAMNQKLKALQSFQQGLAILEAMSKMKPDVLDNVSFDRMNKRAWDLLDMSFDILESDENVEGLRAMRAEEQEREANRIQQEQAGQEQERLASASKNLTEGAGNLQAIEGGIEEA